MAKISVVVNTFNEEKNIVRCLNSVKWADEIVVVDMHSTDKTRELAKKFTSNVFSHEQVGYVEPARNFAIKKATGDWVLILDADEEITPRLAQSLRLLAEEKPEVSIVSLPRKNMIFGKWIQHSGWWPDHQIRFFKKGTVTWKNEIHSVPETSGNLLSLTGEENALVHHNYATIAQFLQKNLVVYAAQEAAELAEKGYKFEYQDAVRFPLKEFLSRYFAREGYKDGFHGLMLAILMAIYHFAVFAYLWEKKKFVDERKGGLQQFGQDIKEAGKEVSYWVHTKSLEEEKSALKRFALKIKRKL